MVPDTGNPNPAAASTCGTERRATDELGDPRRMLATLLDNLPGMVYRCRNDRVWTMEFVSEGCRALTGYAPAELVGSRVVAFGDLILKEDREKVWRQVQAALAARTSFQLTYRLRRPDGSVAWLSERGQGVFTTEGGPDAIEGFITDVTAQRNAEQALIASEEKFEKAFLASPDAISVHEMTSGRFVDVNPGMLRLFGYSRGELIGCIPTELGIWVDEAERRAFLAALRRHGSVRDFKVTVRLKDGRLRLCELSAEAMSVVGRPHNVTVLRDITESRQTEQTLRDSEKKFATAFQASPMALTIVEMANGRFIEVNPAFERISGYTRDEAIGRTSLELGLWSPPDRAAHLARLERDGFVRGMVLTFRARGGHEVLMNSNAEVIVLGGLRCILTVLEDVSEQRQAELRQATLDAQLRQNQKLEALGTLAGGIAHDFNNILTAIVVNQQLALMDIHDAEAVRERLSEIGRASNRAKELVRQILTFSRQQQHERTRQQLQITILEALRLVRASLPATIEIIQDLSPEAPDVLADAGQVHQIVMNLCTNAAHAMRDQPGCLAVRLGVRRLDEAACASRPHLRPGLHAVLTIADTGHGMEPALMARIFEPFFTTKGPGEGTGLGLPMVHGIMRDHDGGIFVESQLGIGTTFELFFPAADQAAADVPVSDEPIERGHGERVLVVDDEPAICAAVGSMLGKLGYRVETFCDPQEGLARFRMTPQAFDLLLTDRTMSRLTGPELIAAALQLRPGLPALLMSGLNEADDDSAPGYDFVAKPLDISLLSQAVRRALDANRPA